MHKMLHPKADEERLYIPGNFNKWLLEIEWYSCHNTVLINKSTRNKQTKTTNKQARKQTTNKTKKKHLKTLLALGYPKSYFYNKRYRDP